MMEKIVNVQMLVPGTVSPENDTKTMCRLGCLGMNCILYTALP